MCPHFEWSLSHKVIRGIFHLCNVDAKEEKNSYFGAFQVSGLYLGMFNIINNKKMTEYLGGCAKIKCKYCYLCQSFVDPRKGQNQISIGCQGMTKMTKLLLELGKGFK